MRDLDTNKAADQFMSWLVRENIFCYSDEDIEETYEELKVDFRETYKVAPRLINLLFDISDN